MNDQSRFNLGLRDTYRILAPYLQRNLMEQVRSIWFIVAYLILFQLFVLQVPIVYSFMIAIGIGVVAIGLMFFMEGLRLGLMPLGEIIGTVLPTRSALPVILLFAFLLGMGATFAEPAIAVLKAAGSGVVADDAPLLYSLLNDFSSQLVGSVGVGVGIAVLLGVLRFFYGWPLKYLAIPVVGMLAGLSLWFSQIPPLADILGLAWDCGAVTTGPVTVPLVLALGIGVSRVVRTGDGENSGFGIVTLASLFPILAVMLLANYHYTVQDYYGAPNYEGERQVLEAQVEGSIDNKVKRTKEHIDIDEETYQRFLETGALPENHRVTYVGGNPTVEDGKIVLDEPQVIIEQINEPGLQIMAEQQWNANKSFGGQFLQATSDALRAIVPLCLFLYLVLRVFLGEKLNHGKDVTIGVGFAVLGMTLFGLGIALGLTPLGSQLGGNVPATFAKIVPWGLDYVEGPIFGTGHAGKIVAVAFAFFLGYGATLAEPALNALGDTVERITVGAFPKRLLMQSVAFGVGLGIAAGIVKISYNLPFIWMLVPPYLVVLFLTWKAPHDFVNFGWDSAGVTTGPITVPLVLAMGLGIGGNVPGVSDGFGILALASVGPILTVLSVGLYTRRRESQEDAEERQTTPGYGTRGVEANQS
ncbi:MAG: DUF1538 domain-containing protein [Pseudomonadota bacterium]